jgi:branched-chain amino acid transport system ATP-binding protein
MGGKHISSILEVRDIHAAYGRIEVLRGVSFRVPRGSVVALLGPNGAGKTTTLKVCSGQMAPTSGQVLIGGVPLGPDVQPEDLVAVGVCTRQLAGKMSGGEQQMLAMSRALATDPALLLLDELSMGLAPLIVEELYGIVRQLAEEGISILVVEQFARTALAVADYGVVMVNGRVVAVGEPADLEADIEAAYLGGAA